ncbi:MAG TPA: YceI family protein [Gaiellaceae bacterium]|jgi:polyisoprenoid-binding protein YceI|nr:YceI family protein [Gaiellaceae bacterium]
MSTIETIAPAGTWQLDPVHSRVDFEVPYLAGTFKGQFREISGELSVFDGHASIEGRAKVASVDVKDETLSAHLQSPDFFDAERHSFLTFTAREIALESERDVTVDGELTIKGVTQPVRVTGSVSHPLVDAYGRDRIGLTLSASVDRTEFGVSWNTPLPSGEQALADEVTISADLQFVKAG